MKRFVSVAVLFLSLAFAQAQTAPKLLPFQSRLTDAGDNPTADGARVVQSIIYEAPVGGETVWNGGGAEALKYFATIFHGPHQDQQDNPTIDV